MKKRAFLSVFLLVVFLLMTCVGAQAADAVVSHRPEEAEVPGPGEQLYVGVVENQPEVGMLEISFIRSADGKTAHGFVEYIADLRMTVDHQGYTITFNGGSKVTVSRTAIFDIVDGRLKVDACNLDVMVEDACAYGTVKYYYEHSVSVNGSYIQVPVQLAMRPILLKNVTTPGNIPTDWDAEWNYQTNTPY